MDIILSDSNPEGKVENQSFPGLNAIVAFGKNREIGFRGDMPWHIPEDLRHFKQITMRHPVIMGRSTWESLPKRPLPGRLNIVITRNPDYPLPEDVKESVLRAGSIQEAMSLCPSDSVPFIIGGGMVYAESMPLLRRIYVTEINAEFPDADTFFPPLGTDEWEVTEQSEMYTSSSGLPFRFLTYERRNNK